MGIVIVEMVKPDEDVQILCKSQHFGTDPMIQSMDIVSIHVETKAQFRKMWCDHFDGTLSRKYFWVLENGYEQNRPFTCAVCSTNYCCIPRNPALASMCRCYPHCNCLCTGSGMPPVSLCVPAPTCIFPGVDVITKTYFDRGDFDMQSCWWQCGFINGSPSTFAHERKTVCCCFNCCTCFNSCCECHASYYCGERVRVVSCEKCCWCVPNRSGWSTNCCGLCGYKTGEPLCVNNCFLTSLINGEGERVSNAIMKTRGKWLERNSHYF